MSEIMNEMTDEDLIAKHNQIIKDLKAKFGKLFDEATDLVRQGHKEPPSIQDFVTTVTLQNGLTEAQARAWYNYIWPL